MQTINVGTITASTILLLYGVLQALALEYLWFVKDWFDTLDAKKKQTANAVGLLVVTGGAYALSYAGVINGFTPDLNGLFAAVGVLIAALIANQGVHAGTKDMF